MAGVESWAWWQRSQRREWRRWISIRLNVTSFKGSPSYSTCRCRLHRAILFRPMSK